jgi:hypothetical protein
VDGVWPPLSAVPVARRHALAEALTSALVCEFERALT